MTRIAHLGPAGTFTEAAIRASSRTPQGATLVPLPTVHDSIVAVEDRGAELALVPVENALEGAVNATLDALAFSAPGVSVVGEEVLAIRHCLVARGPADLQDVEVVLSHPQGLAQCQGFLREHLPHARTEPASSTAEAIRVVSEDGADVPVRAAIGTELAAEIHGGHVLRAGIEDDPANRTRFVWLAGPQARGALHPPVDGAPWKTSVLFGGDGDGRPGWLVRCLSEFAFRGVNLNKIESRPSRQRLGHYVFHVDLDGDVAHAAVADAVGALRDHCSEVRVLGSYPAA